MKKYILFIMFISLFMYSCNDDDQKGNMEPVSNVECTPFIGSVILNWTIPADADYYYTQISYQNSQGLNQGKKVSKFSAGENNKVSVIVGGFTDTEEHEFVLTSYGYSGASSSTVTVKGVPQGVEQAKDYVIETVDMEPANEGAKITWTNETAVGVDLIVNYTDKKNVSQQVIIDATQTGVYMVVGFITETKLTVYAANQEDGGKTPEKVFMITPTIDPDDMIQEGVDYITFGSGANQVSFTQDNPDNRYEYTFVTSGGDPYLNCNGLKQPIAGKTMVFRYKSTAAFDLELFWCNAGGGAAGGRSTTVTVPNNNSGEWKTFRYDYSGAMATHSWAGNAGDFARFDLGSNPGVTINIRNMHFE